MQIKTRGRSDKVFALLAWDFVALLTLSPSKYLTMLSETWRPEQVVGFHKVTKETHNGTSSHPKPPYSVSIPGSSVTLGDSSSLHRRKTLELSVRQGHTEVGKPTAYASSDVGDGKESLAHTSSPSIF